MNQSGRCLKGSYEELLDNPISATETVFGFYYSFKSRFTM